VNQTPQIKGQTMQSDSRPSRPTQELKLCRRKVTLGLAAGLFIGAATAQGADVRSFCESGFAIAQQFGAAGAIWTQQWGLAPASFFPCTAEPSVGFLNEEVTGRQVTQTTGAPVIDANLLLSQPFAGNITLTARDENNEISGEISGAMQGAFVADLNAAHAVATDTTITIRFGSPLHAGPDALIDVTGATGKFQSIQAAGSWQWNVSGSIVIARVPALSLQVNIFAALQNSALILHAEEDVVLSGSYERSAPGR
jgi:hypothetical protein